MPDSSAAALIPGVSLSGQIVTFRPESGEKRIIAKSSHGYDATARFIEKEMKFLNVVWHFRLAPVKAWHQYAEAWIVIVVGVLGSFLVAFGVQNNQELKVMHRRLEEMAQNDPLTGIANRRHFMAGAEAQLSRAARSGQTCFLILFDVDHFKTINDTHGHAAGDAVLVDVADRIKRIIRPYDLFARYGGEEFVLLVMDMDRNEAVGLAERMRLNFCESPFRFNKADIPVTSSFGLARVAPGDDLVKAIERADKALYSAKEAGRNRTVCHEDQA